MRNTMKLSPSGDRDLVISRDFNAPLRFVWDAMTKPELIKRWLSGPPGWRMSVCTVDLKVGGKYRYEWSNDDGRQMGMGGVYREIAAPERLVCTELFDEDWTGGEAVGTLVLVEKDGRTTMTNTIRYASPEARAAVLSSPMESGMAYGYDQLEELVQSLAKGGKP